MKILRFVAASAAFFAICIGASSLSPAQAVFDNDSGDLTFVNPLNWDNDIAPTLSSGDSFISNTLDVTIGLGDAAEFQALYLGDEAGISSLIMTGGTLAGDNFRIGAGTGGTGTFTLLDGAVTMVCLLYTSDAADE